MKSINEIFVNTYEVKQSKFIANLVPYLEYDNVLKRLKQEHPKARHFVVAYRYLNEYNQIVEHSSDDGEPKGTSGRPVLFVLQGSEMINCAVIVVRYFGGTKLGTGGLVRAYSDAVNLVLNKATFFEYEHEIFIKISFEYSNLRKIEYECSACDINVIKKSFDIEVVFELKASEFNMNRFFIKVDRLIRIAE